MDFPKRRDEPSSLGRSAVDYDAVVAPTGRHCFREEVASMSKVEGSRVEGKVGRWEGEFAPDLYKCRLHLYV